MLWRVYDPEGRPVKHAGGDTRHSAIWNAEVHVANDEDGDWHRMYRLGYRCCKVREILEDAT